MRSPEDLRTLWREGRSPRLARSRWTAVLAALGMADSALVALYQMGVFRRLPDLPGRRFDSNAVASSLKGYFVGMPDAALGTLLFAVNLALAAAGGGSSRRQPFLALVQGAAVAAGGAGALYYLWDQVFNQKKACPYCILSILIFFAMVPLAAPEALVTARQVLRALRSRSGVEPLFPGDA